MLQLSEFNKIIPIASVLMMSACGHSNPNIAGTNTEPVRVKVASAASFMPSAGAMSDTYSGTVEAGSATLPSFSVAGTIRQLNVAEGQRIGKGQLLATVDGATLKNTNEIAQAGLREARDAYDRLKKLHDASALPDMQWVAMQEKLKQAEAAAAIAQKGMNDANLYAPISGVVAKKLVDVGQSVAPGVPVVELLDVSTLKVKISVPEADLKKMSAGASAAISAGGRSYNGILAEKAIAANSLSRNYDVKFRVTNPDENLLPGMICSVAVDGASPAADKTQHAEIVLPPQAIVLGWDNESYVWVKENGRAVRKKVATGGLDSRGIIVNGGIAPTDSVIVEGQQKLSSGLEVVSVN